MTYERIVAGLRSLGEEDFDLNPAIDIDKLYRLTEALEKVSSPERAIPEMKPPRGAGGSASAFFGSPHKGLFSGKQSGIKSPPL